MSEASNAVVDLQRADSTKSKTSSSLDRVKDAVLKYITNAPEDDAAVATLMPSLKRCPAIVPLLRWARASNAKNIERNTRIESLEARVRGLEEQIAALRESPR